jgi:hypothetical protein
MERWLRSGAGAHARFPPERTILELSRIVPQRAAPRCADRARFLDAAPADPARETKSYGRPTPVARSKAPAHTPVQRGSHARTDRVAPEGSSRPVPEPPARSVLDAGPYATQGPSRRPRSPVPCPRPPGITRDDHGSHARASRPCHAHRVGPSVPQDASPHTQGVSPLIQDVPSTGQEPDCGTLQPTSCTSTTLSHRPIDSIPASIKSANYKTKTRCVRPRDRRCRADRPRSRRRATWIARRTDSPCRTARPAVHRTRTSTARLTNPCFPWMGPPLCTRGGLLSVRGGALYERRSALCARRDVSPLGEASLRPEKRPPGRPWHFPR